MHYADFILSTHGLLSRIWLAAHWDKKLNKNSVISTDIVKSIENILSPNINVALKTTGHLLLGVVKIYSRQTCYLLHDCTEALTIFSFQSKSFKSQNQANSNVNSRLRKTKANTTSSDLKSNLSRVEDITLQPPDDFLNEMMLLKEFDDDFINDYTQDNHFNELTDVSHIETMRHFNDPSSFTNDISYEVARDQSMGNQNNLTDIFDNTGLTSFGDKLITTNQSIFSNVNTADLDIDTFPEARNPNELIESALNNYTIGDGLSANQSSKMMSFLNEPSKLDHIQLDSLERYAKSFQKSKSKLGSTSTISRKRSLVVDTVKVITEGDDHHLINFKSIVKPSFSTLSTQIHPQKENIPPSDAHLDSPTFTSIPLMTIRSNSSVLMPLARRCATLLSSDYNSDQFRLQQSHSQITHQNTNSINENNANIEDYDFNEDFPFDHNTNYESSNIISTGIVDNTTNDSELYDLDKTLDRSLEKYDHGDIAWSRTTADMARNLLHIYNSCPDNINFNKYVKSANLTDRKSVAQHFYSLLILQRENLFELKQLTPYEDITICPTGRLIPTQFNQTTADNDPNNMNIIMPER